MDYPKRHSKVICFPLQTCHNPPRLLKDQPSSREPIFPQRKSSTEELCTRDTEQKPSPFRSAESRAPVPFLACHARPPLCPFAGPFCTLHFWRPHALHTNRPSILHFAFCARHFREPPRLTRDAVSPNPRPSHLVFPKKGPKCARRRTPRSFHERSSQPSMENRSRHAGSCQSRQGVFTVVAINFVHHEA